MKAFVEVVESKKFKKLLEVILAIGNYLNAGTQKGLALAFKLNTLLLLGDLKSTITHKITLLHYFVKFLELKYPETLDWPKELPSMSKAIRGTTSISMNDFV